MKVRRVLNRVVLSCAVASFCGSGAAAQTTNPMGSEGQSSMAMKSGTSQGIGAADTTFVKKAAQGGMAEVELGQLATQKATNPDVKKFAQRMVDDHTKANNELKAVAGAKNISLPNSLDAKDEATKQKLSGLAGDAFDHAYMSDMVKDHRADVAEFKTESAVAKDSSVKTFASETLPTLEDHLKEAKRIAPEVMKSKMQ